MIAGLSFIFSFLFFASTAYAAPLPSFPSTLLSSRAATSNSTGASTLSCSPVDTFSAYLFISNGTGYMFLGGVRNDTRLKDAIAGVGINADAGDNPFVVAGAGINTGADNTFGFSSCTSKFFQYPANESVDGKQRYYGHITLPSQPGKCVTRRPVGEVSKSNSVEFLTLEPCLTADDVSQATQYFRLIQTSGGGNGAQDNTFTLNNVAHPRDTLGTINYWSPGKNGAPAWVVNPNRVTGWNMGMKNINFNETRTPAV